MSLLDLLTISQNSGIRDPQINKFAVYLRRTFHYNENNHWEIGVRKKRGGMMNTEQRIKMLRLIEKIDKNPGFSQKIGIRNTSAFVSDKSKKITTDSHV